MLFNSHGKFLITGEYLVLEGTTALAVPLRFGQQLRVDEMDRRDNLLTWRSYAQGECWFECAVEKDGFQLVSTTDPEVAATLQRVLAAAREQNPVFLNDVHNTEARIDADFDLSWGLGSSSTLISNIAQWAGVDPYLLLRETFGGSGYDIACATSETPLFYTLQHAAPAVSPAKFAPALAGNIFFVYLGEKMNSRTGMKYFREKASYSEADKTRISELGARISESASVNELEGYLDEHEAIMATILAMPAVKQQRFADYPYSVKSLGAWGGDFVMATGRSAEEVRTYFNAKGMPVIFTYDEIIK